MFSLVQNVPVLTVGVMNTAVKRVVPAASRANRLNGREWLRSSFSVWRGLGKNSEERKLAHPAMFSLRLVSRLLDVYTCGEGVALDPFAGVGTVLLAADEKKMSGVGLDINSEYRDAFIGRASPLIGGKWQYHLCDAREMNKVIAPESVDICITSPPYWDILNRRRTADGKDTRSYSDAQNDIGNISSYGDFLTALSIVMNEVRRALKPGGYFILNVMDLRKGAKFYPLHMDAATEAVRSGFTLEDIIIWDRQEEYNNMRPLGYPYKFIINKVHEYLLVLR